MSSIKHHIKTHPAIHLSARNRLRSLTGDNSEPDSIIDCSENAQSIETNLEENNPPVTEINIVPLDDAFDEENDEEYKNVRAYMKSDAGDSDFQINVMTKQMADVLGGWAKTEKDVSFRANEELHSSDYYAGFEDNPLYVCTNQIDVHDTVKFVTGADTEFAANLGTLPKKVYISGYADYKVGDDSTSNYNRTNWLCMKHWPVLSTGYQMVVNDGSQADGRMAIVGNTSELSSDRTEIPPLNGGGESTPIEAFKNTFSNVSLWHANHLSDETKYRPVYHADEIYTYLNSNYTGNEHWFVTTPQAGVFNYRTMNWESINAMNAYITAMNYQQLATNTSNISSLESRIQALEDDDLDSRLTQAQADIITNAGNISTNATNINNNTTRWYQEYTTFIQSGTPAVDPGLSSSSLVHEIMAAIEAIPGQDYTVAQKVFIMINWMSALSWF